QDRSERIVRVEQMMMDTAELETPYQELPERPDRIPRGRGVSRELVRHPPDLIGHPDRTLRRSQIGEVFWRRRAKWQDSSGIHGLSAPTHLEQDLERASNDAGLCDRRGRTNVEHTIRDLKRCGRSVDRCDLHQLVVVTSRHG